MSADLEARGIGKIAINYRLRDWLFSRQRYWGEPFPILHRQDGTHFAIPHDELPLTLPEVESYQPSGTGESPLSTITSWITVKDRETGEVYRRESNTMPQWAGSCWYYLRYIDPHNDSPSAFSKEKADATGCPSTSTSAAPSTPCCTCSTRASGTRCSTISASCRASSRSTSSSTRA